MPQVTTAEFFKNFRKQRGIKLAAVGKQMSSSLSRFERGKQALSSEKMAKAMTVEGIWIDDLADAVVGFRSEFCRLATTIVASRFAPDSQQIATWTHPYLVEHAEDNDPLALVSRAVIEVVTESVNRGVALLLLDDTQTAVVTILLNSHSWTTYDYLLFRLAMPHLDFDRNKLVYAHMQSQSATTAVGYESYQAMVSDAMGILSFLKHDLKFGASVCVVLKQQDYSAYRLDDVLTSKLLILLLDPTIPASTRDAEVEQISLTTRTLALGDVSNFVTQLINRKWAFIL